MGKLKKYIEGLKSQKVAVIGMGISNSPLIGMLLKAGVETTIRDKRGYEQLGEMAEKFKAMGAGFVLGEDYLDDLDEKVIFRTPGLMPGNFAIHRAVRQGAVLTSEMEVFFDICPCRIIGITGSDGKTTTTAIIAKLLENQGIKVHIGGNIGNPLLPVADSIKPDDIAVVELSSFQLITMKKSPNIAVVTNITPNHLDVHEDVSEYIQAKSNIFMYQMPGDKLVINLDNGVTRRFERSAPPGSEVIFFSSQGKINNGVYLDTEAYYDAMRSRDDIAGAVIVDTNGKRSTEILEAGEILLPGIHNVENYLAAFAAVRDMVSVDVMRETARTFKGVEHRLELVRELGGVRYYNDSIASSPSRTIAGLASFNQKVILIAGGKDKGIAFDELGGVINRRVKKLILTGATSKHIYAATVNAPEYDGRLEITQCPDFKDAVIEASESAEKGDIVLLSPACTSFDRFTNFEERGNLFKEIVNGL